MDGRWKLAVAGGLIAGLVGCTTTKPVVPPTPPTPPPGKNSLYIPEPADDAALKDGPLSATTKLAYANVAVEAVAQDATKPAAERDRLLSQARQVYQEVLAEDPKNVDALFGLGELYHVTGEQQRLTDVLAKATKTHPQNAKVWAWVAVKHGQAKNWEPACEAYARATKLDPDNRMYRIHLGFNLARAGRYDEGYECMSRSMREAEARYNLAMMMLHNGDVERAKMELKLAQKADPNFAAAGEKLAGLANGPAPADTRQAGFEELDPVKLAPAH